MTMTFLCICDKRDIHVIYCCFHICVTLASVNSDRLILIKEFAFSRSLVGGRPSWPQRFSGGVLLH